MSARTILLWIHLLAAVTWLGGLVTRWLIVLPVLGSNPPTLEQLQLGLRLEARFRVILWPAVGITLFTGLANLGSLWYTVTVAGGYLPYVFVSTLGLKLLLIVGIIVLQAYQQLGLLPMRLRLLMQPRAEGQDLPEAFYALQRREGLIQALSVGLAAAVLYCALRLRGA